ncbi:hypothetical protein FTX61_11465 [Nitriliruptoraceae bacterium ZYF776]|nr:hypothetical protein [Profundirhabdus halotolerans]
MQTPGRCHGAGPLRTGHVERWAGEAESGQPQRTFAPDASTSVARADSATNRRFAMVHLHRGRPDRSRR